MEEEVRLQRPRAVGLRESPQAGHPLETAEDWTGYRHLKRCSRKLEPVRSLEQLHLGVRPGDRGGMQRRIILENLENTIKGHMGSLVPGTTGGGGGGASQCVRKGRSRRAHSSGFSMWSLLGLLPVQQSQNPEATHENAPFYPGCLPCSGSI